MTSWNLAASRCIDRLLCHVSRCMAVVACGISFSGCAAPRVELNDTVLCGRSSSDADLACNAPLLRNAVLHWSTEVPRHGAGRFEIALVGTGIDDTPVVFSRRYPLEFPAPISRSRRAWQDSLIRSVDSVAGLLGSTRGSAVAEGVFRVSIRMPDGPNIINRLIVASDLRQYTPGRWNFERAVPPFDAFRAWVEEEGLAPRLNAFSVIVACGVHLESPSRTTPLSAATYSQLRRLWSRMLAEWAPQSEIHEECDAWFDNV